MLTELAGTSGPSRILRDFSLGPDTVGIRKLFVPSGRPMILQTLTSLSSGH